MSKGLRYEKFSGCCRLSVFASEVQPSTWSRYQQVQKEGIWVKVGGGEEATGRNQPCLFQLLYLTAASNLLCGLLLCNYRGGKKENDNHKRILDTWPWPFRFWECHVQDLIFGHFHLGIFNLVTKCVEGVWPHVNVSKICAGRVLKHESLLPTLTRRP